MAKPVVAPGRVVAVYAGFWRRLSAFVLDLLFIGMVAIVLHTLTQGNETWRLLALFAAIYVIGLTLEGGTIGKRLLNLRIVRSDGRPIDWVRTFARELVLKPLLMLSFVWVAVTRRKQSWYDMILDTVVVHERWAPAAPEWGEAPPWLDTVDELAAERQASRHLAATLASPVPESAAAAEPETGGTDYFQTPPERPDRPERPAHPEHPGHGDHRGEHGGYEPGGSEHHQHGHVEPEQPPGGKSDDDGEHRHNF